MRKSNNLAKESPEFIDLEIVESESGKPYVEIEMPRNSWVHVLHWCLEHRTPLQIRVRRASCRFPA